MTASLDARLKAGAQDIEYDGYSDLLREAASALAAERDRADRAEARLAIVWDEGYDASSTDWDNGGPGDPNPYHSEATA